MIPISVVSASAGSGKTYRLSGLLLEEITSGSTRPQAVLCTTFTNKAAAELQARVRARLLEAGRTREADALSSARIGTVNAVCGHLAMEFAFELGLSPELRVLDETTAAQLLSQAMSSVVSEEQAERLGDLRFRMPEFDWADSVRRMVSLARANLLGPDDLRAARGPATDRLMRLYGTPQAAEREKALDQALLEALSTFIASVDTAADTTKTTQTVLWKVKGFRNQLRRGSTLNWADWLNLSNLAAAKKSDALLEPVRLAAAEHDTHPRLHRDLRAATELVYELAAGTLEAYAAHKRERGVLDFVDQEVHAHTLLDRPDIQERLRGELDLVLVDEFQDTSPLQLSIFLKLAHLAKRSVWVGDQKQSIYGFRGADPSLMDAAIEALCGDKGPETLSTSHRSRAPLVAATSDAFALAFAPHGMPAERVRLTPKSDQDAPELGAWVESWELSARKIADELKALANGVRTLLLDPTLRVRDRTTGVSRAARPSDVAALCFSNRQCEVVADALEDLGIRAVVPRSGLFATPEGVAALAGLRLFVDGRDALAAAEVARVLVYSDDPDLFLSRALSQPGIEAYLSLEPYQRVRAEADRLRATGAVGALDAVLEALELREHCLSWGRSAQRLTNLEAIRAHAVAFAATSGGESPAASAAGLVAYLEALKAEELDSQATATGDDAVVVSTWHAAKGLEWPVTILYGGPPEPSALGLAVETTGTFSLEAPLAGRSLRFWPTPYRLAHNKAPFHQRLEESAEQAAAVEAANRQNLRVLYVGWTRARDRLVLTARKGGAEGPLVKLLRTGGGAAGEVRQLVTSVEGDLVIAGKPAGAMLRTLKLGVAQSVAPVAGAAPKAAGPRAHPPAFVSPSSVETIGTLSEVASIGERVPLSGEPEMNDLGEAVHGFLGADDPALAVGERAALADALLRKWGVRSALKDTDLVTISDRLRAYVQKRWPQALWRREYPIQLRLADGSVARGTVDLALELPEGLLVIDHKSFPGSRAQAEARVVEYAGQLDLYGQALSAATGKPLLGTFIHLPISGLVAEIRGDAAKLVSGALLNAPRP